MFQLNVIKFNESNGDHKQLAKCTSVQFFIPCCFFYISMVSTKLPLLICRELSFLITVYHIQQTFVVW